MRNALVLIICLAALMVRPIPGFAETKKIIIAGTGDSQSLLRNLAQAYEKAHPGTHIIVPDSIGSSGGIKAVAAGKCDLGRIARTIKANTKFYGLTYKCFAYSPVVFAINPSVQGIENLVYRQILGIYSGEIGDWKDLGGAAGEIYVVNREPGDSSRTVLNGHIPGFKDIQTPAGKIIYTTPEAVQILKEYENTIGYVPMAMVKWGKLHVCSINGIAPTSVNVQEGRYPLSVPLGLVWKGELEALSLDFVKFVLSPEGKNLISENGAIPVTGRWQEKSAR